MFLRLAMVMREDWRIIPSPNKVLKQDATLDPVELPWGISDMLVKRLLQLHANAPLVCGGRSGRLTRGSAENNTQTKGMGCYTSVVSLTLRFDFQDT